MITGRVIQHIPAYTRFPHYRWAILLSSTPTIYTDSSYYRRFPTGIVIRPVTTVPALHWVISCQTVVVQHTYGVIAVYGRG